MEQDNSKSLNADPRVLRLLQLQGELDARKALYAEFDALILDLAQSGFVKTVIDDLTIELKDNFANGNTSFTSAAVKRYDLEVRTAEQIARREKKQAKASAS